MRHEKLLQERFFTPSNGKMEELVEGMRNTLHLLIFMVL
jgi:hypothetical protein